MRLEVPGLPMESCSDMSIAKVEAFSIMKDRTKLISSVSFTVEQ